MEASPDNALSRAAVMAGAVNGVELIALRSDTELYMPSSRLSITAQDVASLRDDPQRNRLIIDVMGAMLLLQRQGLVACAPGKAATHAELLAEVAGTSSYYDPRTDERRPLRVQAVHPQLANSDLQASLEALRLNELDALAVSDYSRVLPYPRFRYAVMATHSSSEADVQRLLGSVARPGPDERRTKIFYIVDALKILRNRKTIHTPFSVFGATQGAVLHAGADAAAEPVTASITEGLPVRIMQRVRAIPEGAVIADVLLPDAPLAEANEGYRPLTTLPAIIEGRVTVEGVKYILSKRFTSEEGDPPMVNVVGPQRSMAYVSPEAAAFVEARYIASHKVALSAIQDFLAGQHWPQLSGDAFETACEAAGVEPIEERRALRLSIADTGLFLAQLATIPFVDPQREVHAAQLARMMNLTTSHAYKLIGKDEYLQPLLLHRRRGMQHRAYSPVGAFTVEAAVEVVGELVVRSPKAEAAVARRAYEEVVSKAQVAYQEYCRQHPFQPVLGQAAIEAFLADLATRLSDDGDADDDAGSAKGRPRDGDRPEALVDEA